MNNKYILIAPIILAAILMMTPLLTTVQSVSAAKFTNEETFSVDKDGTVTTTPIINDHSNSASAAKSDSAANAESQNNVKCFAFCLGVSNAQSNSAANSDSRTNSPGNTATAQPFNPQVTTTVNPNEITSLDTKPHHKNHHHDDSNFISTPLITPHSNNNGVGTTCFDNTGSVQDEGYSFGYNDAQTGKSIMSISDHGHHTDIWRTGYRDGFQAGLNDLANGVHLSPC